MRTEMYIPKTITVGFQTRQDTFTGKLGYVIYTDHKGKLRKEASWQGWRDKKIESVTFDNTPTPGFTLNKGVKRDGYWGNGRSVIRVWDPRDFEFEITVDNLIGILMHADVSKRDITEPCVFAWYGTELVLLPTNSVEYQESVKYTENQSKKFSAKDLVVGYTYKTRKGQEDVVYLGRLEHYQFKSDRGSEVNKAPQLRKGLTHKFIGVDSKTLHTTSPSALIAHVVQEEVHPNFASLMDTYYKSETSQPVVGLRTAKQPIDKYFTPYVKVNDNTYMSLHYDTTGGNYWSQQPRTYVLRPAEVVTWNPETNMIERISPYRYDRTQVAPIGQAAQDCLAALQPKFAQLVSEQDTSKYYDWNSLVKRVALEADAGELQLVLADGKTAPLTYSIYY